MNNDRNEVELLYSQLVDEIGTQPGLAKRVLEQARRVPKDSVSSRNRRILSAVGLVSGMAVALALTLFSASIMTSVARPTLPFSRRVNTFDAVVLSRHTRYSARSPSAAATGTSNPRSGRMISATVS